MLARLFSFILLALVFTSCADTSSGNCYDFTCAVAEDLKCDSISLYVYEDDYTQIRMIGVKRLRNRKANFIGRINDSRVAFVKLNNDSVPHFFVLEADVERMQVSKHSFKLEGGKSNQEYYTFLLKRMNLINTRKQLKRQYQKELNDSTLTDQKEKALYAQDHKAYQSLQRLISSQINEKKIYSKIVRQRFSKELTEENYSKLR